MYKKRRAEVANAAEIREVKTEDIIIKRWAVTAREEARKAKSEIMTIKQGTGISKCIDVSWMRESGGRNQFQGEKESKRTDDWRERLGRWLKEWKRRVEKSQQGGLQGRGERLRNRVRRPSKQEIDAEKKERTKTRWWQFTSPGPPGGEREKPSLEMTRKKGTRKFAGSKEEKGIPNASL